MHCLFLQLCVQMKWIYQCMEMSVTELY
uniref:Uncharacterized protein n=2 Tax=Anguilla anguilla TaxID=7936 RepID=A0A0E9TR48_ANGAN